MRGIKLTFKNESNDKNNSEVVIFQKNVAANFDEIAVAWKVIKNCATGWEHQFSFPMDIKVGASDSWGNEIIEPISAENGEVYHVFNDSSGDQLAYKGSGASKKEVQVQNSLSKGSINANIYKDGKLLATKMNISPEQKAVFEFKPTFWIGVVSQIEEGQIMNSAIISDINTEIGLLNVASADIAMRGGGTDQNTTGFTFSLENVKYL